MTENIDDDEILKLYAACADEYIYDPTLKLRLEKAGVRKKVFINIDTIQEFKKIKEITFH